MVVKREVNPIRQMAMNLAHQMEDERKTREEFLQPWKEEEIREAGRCLRDEIFKKGYDINQLLFLAEQYKTLSWAEYSEWVYQT